MKSTQIYLTEEQLRALKRLKEREGKPVAFLVREAVESYLVEKKEPVVTFKEALHRTAGIWADRTDITDGASYIRKLRKQMTQEFERRQTRLWNK